MTKIIDPHLHFFDLQLGHYDWLKSENAPYWNDKSLIAKNFNYQDVLLTKPLRLCAFVHIEAGFDNVKPQNELAWLSNTYSKPLVYKAVSFADISLPLVQFSKHIDELNTFACLVGIRHILDDDWPQIVQSANTLKNLRYLASQNLLFELQCDFSNEQQARALFTLFASVPELTLVINHAGKAQLPIKQDLDQAAHTCWQESSKRFATLPRCWVKCSGLEMTNRRYSHHDLKWVLTQLIAEFGISRVMMASNFPLTLLSMTYVEYWQMVMTLIDELGLDKHALLHDNAARCYTLAC